VNTSGSIIWENIMVTGGVKIASTTSLQKLSLLLVAVSSFLIPFMGSSLSIALPLIQNDLAVDILVLGWIPTAFTLANAALVLPFGRLADIHGRKKIFTYGITIYTIASFLAVFSSTGLMLIFFSFLQGVGCAMIFATGVALLISIFPQKHRGEVLGIYLTAVYVGLFLGPLLGGFLAHNLGWESIFLANVPIGLFLLSLILTSFRGEWKSADGEKFDRIGTIIYIFSLSVLMYGISTLNEVLGKTFLIIGFVSLILFLIIERRSSSPIIPLNIFKNRITSFSGVALFLVTVSTSAMWTLISLYLQELRGLDPLTTAIILAVQPLAVAVLSPLVGRMVDTNNNKIVNIVGAIICTAGLVILSFLDGKSSLVQLILGLLMVGIGMGLFTTPTNRNFLQSISSKYYGVGSATMSTMVFIGQTVSLGVLLSILTKYMGTVQLLPPTYPFFIEGLQFSFLIFAVTCAIGVVVSLIIREKMKTQA